MAEINPLVWPGIPARLPYWLWQYTLYFGVVVVLNGLVGFFIINWIWATVLVVAGFVLWGLGFWLEYVWTLPNIEAVEAQLQGRDPTFANSAWRDAEKRELLAELCNACVDWRSQVFVPEDPCWLVLHPHSYQDGPASERLRVWIDQTFREEMSPIEAEKLVQRSMGHVVDFLNDIKQQRGWRQQTIADSTSSG
jgi:hypothetical protein